MLERSGKTVYPKIGVWFDEAAGDIHLSIPGHGLSTVNRRGRAVGGEIKARCPLYRFRRCG